MQTTAKSAAWQSNASTSVWRNRDFLLMWLPQAFSSLGTEMSLLALPLVVLARTGSTSQAGFVAATRGVSLLVLLLPSGLIVDRVDRRRLMLACEIVGALAMATIACALLSDTLTMPLLYVAALVEGCTSTLFDAANTASVGQRVSARQLPAAAAAIQGIEAFAMAFGPPLGGMLFVVAPFLPFAIDAASCAASAVCVAATRTPLQGPRPEQRASLRALARELAEGARFFWRERVLRVLALLTMTVFAASLGYSLVIIVLARRLGSGPGAIGLIVAASGAGMVCGGLLAMRMQHLRLRVLVAVPMLVWTISWPLWLLAPNTVVLTGCVAIAFVAVAMYQTTSRAYRLAVIPDRLQGRVNGVFKLLTVGMHPLSLALTGVALELVGPTRTIAAITVILAIATLCAMLARDLRDARPFAELLRPAEPPPSSRRPQDAVRVALVSTAASSLVPAPLDAGREPSTRPAAPDL